MPIRARPRSAGRGGRPAGSKPRSWKWRPRRSPGPRRWPHPPCSPSLISATPRPRCSRSKAALCCSPARSPSTRTRQPMEQRRKSKNWCAKSPACCGCSSPPQGDEQYALDQLLVSGGRAGTPGLAETATEKLGLPVALADPFDQMAFRIARPSKDRAGNTPTALRHPAATGNAPVSRQTPRAEDGAPPPGQDPAADPARGGRARRRGQIPGTGHGLRPRTAGRGGRTGGMSGGGCRDAPSHRRQPAMNRVNLLPWREHRRQTAVAAFRDRAGRVRSLRGWRCGPRRGAHVRGRGAPTRRQRRHRHFDPSARRRHLRSGSVATRDAGDRQRRGAIARPAGETDGGGGDIGGHRRDRGAPARTTRGWRGKAGASRWLAVPSPTTGSPR